MFQPLNVDYEPPEDGLVRAETYVGVKELKNENNKCILLVCNL
jgi:hypothetical protein